VGRGSFLAVSERPGRILPAIVASQFAGTSLWFAGNAILPDLQREWGLGDGAVAAFLGSWEDVPERYAVASPAALAPLGVPQLLVHGSADDIVPPSQSRGYAALDPEAALLELEGVDHFEVIDPGHAAWTAVVERLPRLLRADILAR